MAKCFIEDTTLTSIGDAIRAKTGGTDLMLPSAMPAAIEGIISGGDSGLYVWKKYEAPMITFYVNGGFGSYIDTLTCYEGETWESYASRNSKVTISFGNNIFYDGNYLYSDSSYSSVVLKTDKIISGRTYYSE